MRVSAEEKPGEIEGLAGCLRTAQCLPPPTQKGVPEAPQDRWVKRSPYLAQPFKQALCMASMMYRRNSCASSWFPKWKCRAISTEGSRRRHTGSEAFTLLFTHPTTICLCQFLAAPRADHGK